MNYGWHDLLGNTGVILVLGTYLLLQMHRMSAKTPSFSVLNAIGAALILVSLSQDFNLSAFIIEVSWLVISIYGVVRSLRQQDAAS